MKEVWFLLILGGIWLLVASICDLKKREIPNWISFSLIIFALGFRALFSVYNGINFFLFGLLGFGIYFVLAYVFYYSRFFAGGDSKLLMGIGPVIPISGILSFNLILLFGFVILLLLVGSLYGLIYSFILVLINKKRFVKDFKKRFRQGKVLVLMGIVFSVLVFGLSYALYFPNSWIISLLILIFPFLFIYAKSVEESCMIKPVKGKNVTIGDWLYEKVKIGNKIINPNWEGLSEKEAKLIKNKAEDKKIKIKQGIPFVPAFFIAFILLFYLWYSFGSFWNSFLIFWF